MVTSPVRAGPVFAAHVTTTVPLPLPDEADDICSQLVFESAVHAHPAPVVTATLVLPLPPATLKLPGARAKLQEVGAGGVGEGAEGGGGVGVAETAD